MKLFGTSCVNEKGNLSIGGVDTLELVKEFKTPLYVMDQELIEGTIDKMKKSFKSSRFSTQIAYAGKAFLTTGMIKLVESKGLDLDVVSGGEMYTAYKAGFPMDKVHLHGNNKTIEELEMAVDFGIGRTYAEELPFVPGYDYNKLLSDNFSKDDYYEEHKKVKNIELKDYPKYFKQYFNGKN